MGASGRPRPTRQWRRPPWRWLHRPRLHRPRLRWPRLRWPRPWWLWLPVALAGSLTLAAWRTSAPAPVGLDTPTHAAVPVTAVPATAPPRSQWDSVAGAGPSAHLGSWVLESRFLVLAELADEGLATVRRPGRPTEIVFRGELSVSPDLRRQGWAHIGDPDGWHGYLFDAYQAAPSAGTKLFQVTTPDGVEHPFIHRLSPDEQSNNSFVAISPDGAWMVSGEWGQTTRLLVFPAPLSNPASGGLIDDLPLTATIRFDHPARDIQGCAFVSSVQLLCATADPGRDLWGTPDQLLRVILPRELDGTTMAGHVESLGQLPLLSDCQGAFEVEGIDYQPDTSTLRVEVRPPGQCGLSIAVYVYRPAHPAK